MIGIVVKQNEPANNYVNQFGPFWAEVFGEANLYTVYSAAWFLLILAFLVTSTSLCIARQAPKIFADLKEETWALIVWLNYAAWLHMRLMKGLRDSISASWALTGSVVTTFAFLGVNMFLSGLHSCGEL